MHLQINDLARPVVVDGAPEVIDVLRAITRGWTIEPAAAPADPVVRIRRSRGRYGISAARRRGALCQRTAVSAACSLVVDLVEATADARPDMLCLHAGAARLGERLVVFPSRRRAGKSTLIARLASKDAEVFADDVLPLVARGKGLVARAFGVASRLRLPLPATLPAAFHRWAARHGGPTDDWYRYIAPLPGRLAPLGTRARIAAFVFLDRSDDDAPPSLHRAPEGAALEALLLQNFGIAASASEILDRLAQLISTAGVYVLRYGALDPAVDLLRRSFAADATPAAGPEIPLPLPPLDPRPPAGGTALDGTFRQAAGLELRTIGGRPFIGDDVNGAVFALDGPGGAIWGLLEEPTSPAEITAALAHAFPAVPLPTIQADVTAFLHDLRERRLVTQHEETTP